MKKLVPLTLALALGLTACGTAGQNPAPAASPTPAGDVQGTETPANTEGFPFTLTTKDGAWEATFDTDYQIYKDLTLAVELGYIHLSLNDGVWGNVLDNTNRNAYKASVNMRYAF